MSELVELIVKDGPQIGQKISIPGDECTLGGKGSGADIELSGVPYGVKFAELKQTAGKWILIEFEPKSILLNDQHLKRRNTLKNGDFIRLPSLKKGQSYRYDLALTVPKKEKATKEKSASAISPAILIGGGAYVVLMLLVGMYFMMNAGGNATSQGQLQISQVLTALDEDLKSIDTSKDAARMEVALSNRPETFNELKTFLQAGLSEEEKTALEEDFKNQVLTVFSDAWRMEQQEKYPDAAELYGKVIAIMVDRHLKTTEIALDRLSVLQ
ncbi:hypothetical protein GCM10007939_22290 [Amylibacter marinus]|uniref:FHA domain-containing protein n=1 Tax=Amylibacter marinus TaxID=1475483 RepID=A0ABQ5VWZ2_9RHOB|nr:FHA domain-containing protein [Amylibacter marinus]GLQ35945.1 hypothetical protein GCM10007939_22290 [Amylibacter marinus]